MTIAPQAVSKTIRKLPDILLAPLTLLERARGRWRLLLLVVYAIVLTILGGLLWRATSLWGLPDIGEPFDVAAFQSNKVPDEENAFTLYEEAARKMVEPRDRVKATQGWAERNVFNGYGWKRTPENVREWLEDNRDALALWKRGTELDRAQPRRAEIKEPWKSNILITKNSQLCTLAGVEASRFQDSVDFSGAWEWCLASYRANRHFRADGSESNSQADWDQTEIVMPTIQHWLHDSANRPVHIRKALADLIKARSLGGGGEEAIKAFYLDLMKSVDRENRDEWLAKEREKLGRDDLPSLVKANLRWFFLHEPERSQRLLKIAFANGLAHRSLNPDAPPRVSVGLLSFWDLDERAPAEARVLSGEEFLRWHDSCIVLNHIDMNSIQMLKMLEFIVTRTRVADDDLLADVVETLFELEHGRRPKTSDELIKAYADELPQDIQKTVRARIDFVKPAIATPAKPIAAP